MSNDRELQTITPAVLASVPRMSSAESVPTSSNVIASAKAGTEPGTLSAAAETEAPVVDKAEAAPAQPAATGALVTALSDVLDEQAKVNAAQTDAYKNMVLPLSGEEAADLQAEVAELKADVAFLRSLFGWPTRG